MHRFVVLGINHKQAPLEVRERLAYPERRLPAALRVVCDALDTREAVILSTCNRVEIYAFAEHDNARVRLLRVLAADHGLQTEFLERYCYFHRSHDAIEHLMRVAGGLDSLVLGETQILSQVKKAYLQAQSENFTAKHLNALFLRAFQVAKRLHSETAIGQGQVSVSSVAVRFIRRVFEDLGTKTALLVGAGEVGELTLTYLRDQGIGRVVVVSRTMDRAREVASRFGGDAVPFELLHDYLPAADVVITQTSSEARILTRHDFAQSQKKRGHAPVFVLDLAVPRDVAEDAAELDGLFLYNVDDLEQVIAEHAEERSRELERCQAIVREETERFMGEVHSYAAGPLISALRGRADTVKEAELERLLARLSDLPISVKDELAAFAERLTSKLIHPQLSGIRREASRGDEESLRRIASALGMDEGLNTEQQSIGEQHAVERRTSNGE
jgi:glutamyl-tRNA reductase